ncbi:MAG: hypothetical protein U0800_16195 [Isosphaeraceae bacterium]
MSAIAALAIAMAGVRAARGIREEREASRRLETIEVYYSVGAMTAERFERASESLARLRAAHAFTRSGRLAAYREHVRNLRVIVRQECTHDFGHPGDIDTVDCLEYREKLREAERRLAAME